MKQVISLLLLLILGSQRTIASGIRLSGTFSEMPSTAITVTFLLGDSYYDTYRFSTQTNPEGGFHLQLQPDRITLAEITGGTRRFKVLLVPGRDLELQVPADANDVIVFRGTGARENELMYWTAMARKPFFAQADYRNNPYVQVSHTQWFDRIELPVQTELKELDFRLAGSGLPDSLKNYLTRETRYAWQCYLNDFTNNDLQWAGNTDRNGLLEKVMNWQPMPDSLDLADGFYSNMFVVRMARWQVNRLADDKKRSRKEIQDLASAYLGYTFPQIDSLVRKYGESCLLVWMYSEKYLPANIRDRVLYNKIMDAFNAGDLASGFWLMDKMKSAYPSSAYLAAAEKISSDVQEQLAASPDVSIVYRKPGTIGSFAELLKPYRGKPVLLDIWGTWCGPCRSEMMLTPALKKEFAGTGLVFLYLDMDDKDKEDKWQKYVRYFGITGEHYRMDNKEIQLIWKEIKNAGGITDRYPTYVLVDRQGKIRFANAAAPSDGKKLSAQIRSMF